ncbi:MAG: tyrosine-type recombinase/integrase [Lentisphaeria bacterium]|nr:tyrosine-type recombinase/integrase [Lentisphaeria bacterium]
MPGMRSLPLPVVLELLDRLPEKYACLAAIGVPTGCRISELLLLQRHDLLDPAGVLRKEIAFIKLKSRGDKVIRRRLAIPEDYHSYIYRHLLREEQRGYDMPGDWVFRGRNGKPLSRRTAYNCFRKILGSGYGTHWMRKTFAQEIFKFFLEENIKDPMRALELTRRALDHKRLDTTVRYLGINEKALEKAQKTVFSRERIINGRRNSDQRV